MHATDMRPFATLFQKNLALFSRFAMSPEVLGRGMADAHALVARGQGTARHLAGSAASMQLMHGLFRNYTEFVAELGRSVMVATLAPAATRRIP